LFQWETRDVTEKLVLVSAGPCELDGVEVGVSFEDATMEI
jgi:hypothetical protein